MLDAELALALLSSDIIVKPVSTECRLRELSESDAENRSMVFIADGHWPLGVQ